jgi:hypothetical protein
MSPEEAGGSESGLSKIGQGTIKGMIKAMFADML